MHGQLLLNKFHVHTLVLALENFNPLDDADGTFELLLRVYLKSFQGHLTVYEENYDP